MKEKQRNGIFSTAPSGDSKVFSVKPPGVTLPKGGGAIHGMGEKFANNPVIGTGAMSVPLTTSAGRAGFGPQLSLSYDSGAGNGEFGLGWHLSLPAITRKTHKGLPQYPDALPHYFDNNESDVFVLAGAEDLVPETDALEKLVVDTTTASGYAIHRYRPRVEGLFARIERWVSITDPQDCFWCSITRDNITTWYGKDSGSRVYDPDDPSHIFSWLIGESYDDKGNAIVYEYVAENVDNVTLANVHERNRTVPGRSVNRYIKRIRYGNKTSRLLEPDLAKLAWHFQVVFDYGENHYQEISVSGADPFYVAAWSDPPTPVTWPCRADPFSHYRAGFEVRRYRLCRRVLMFHDFTELGETPCLVGSTEFHYDENPIVTYMKSVSHSGYIRQRDTNQAWLDRYLRESLPPLDFTYSQMPTPAQMAQLPVAELEHASLANLPIGLKPGEYQWVDLDGEGIAGILNEQAGTWYYKDNLGDGRLGAARAVGPLPSLLAQNGTHELFDLDGDGQVDVVLLDTPTPGFYSRSEDDEWEPYRAFDQVPNITWRDPNLRFLDVTGDGCADVVIAEDNAFTWYGSMATAGFSPAVRVAHALDEEQGPRLMFADGTETIFLTDMSGDGLTDIVRIRNGEVCYWPNLGYGRFGRKVAMDNSPWFDTPDLFEPRRIRLADIDGNGVTDIVYLGRDAVRIYFNCAGNGWTTATRLPQLPRVDNLADVQVVDLLGLGTACLVWSSPLPGEASRPLRYIDLMAGQKPHLLIQTVNNLGAETRVEYVSSTHFYLADKLAGKPWITKLPFPVHVVQRVETIDHIGKSRFVSRYAYHHGYYDGIEREFRGFGMVEQFDTEAFEDYVVGVQHIDGDQELAPELYQPPVTTRTWYHTGAYLDQKRILHQYRHEYYQQQQYTPEPVLPDNLSPDEMRECVRALKGLPLRQEVYSFDGTAVEQHPYTLAEYSYEVRRLQARGDQRHGVFLSLGRESISMEYERNPADPRVVHGFALESDDYGNARKSCSVVYGRKSADPSLPAAVSQAQQNVCITYTETDYTTDIDRAAPTRTYRLRIPYETRHYEITGVVPSAEYFDLDEIKTKIAGASPIDYEIVADGVSPQKRLFSQGRSLFLDDSLNPLPLGQWDTLGLGYQSYSLAFTPGINTTQYAGKVADAEFTAAGYVHFAGDTNWWIPSGTQIYPADPHTAFYLPIGSRDPLGLETTATFDAYYLLVEKIAVNQAAWNVVTANNDYRILAPVQVTNPNGNRSAVEYDALGMVTKSAVMGKTGSTDGDTLADPTVRMEYDLFNWMNNRKPNYVHTFAREQHGAANPRWQESYAYSNGSGGVALVKSQAHPGKAFQVNPDGTKTEVDANPRWVGNGRTVLNNKGNAVKQYEPYFSTTQEYEDEKVLREIGVTPILYYDPLGRNIRTLYPNGTFARVEFTPWAQKVFDANDTVKQSQWYVDRGSPDPATQPEPVNDPERRAAWLAAKHADTPGLVHFDNLGRPVYAVSDYGGGKTAAARSVSDMTGRLFKLYDQMQREVASGFVGMTGSPLVGNSAEKGRRWTFQNVLGAMVKTWDEHGRQFRAEYDNLHRPVSTFVQESGHAEILCNYVVYGDHLANAAQLNLLGVAHMVFDQAGMLRMPQLDFKGNPTSVDRILAIDYKNNLDWSMLANQPDVAAVQTAANAALETGEVFSATSQYDALNRPTQAVLPDGTVMVPTYNEANVLATLKAQVRGQGAFVEFLKEQDYDAKGQRQFAHYGNDVITQYFHDPNTFRLTNLLTYKSSADPTTQSLQNINYYYDPAGNITQISDASQQTQYFNNAVVKPENLYEYDAVYHLIRATGRELAGGVNDSLRIQTDLAFVQLPQPNNADAVRTYTEEYEYDLLGNIKTLKHRFATQPTIGNGWTRHYRYAFDAVPGDLTNRMTATSLPGDPDAGPYTGSYDYDVYGNMTRMPHLASMDWNFMDQLRQVDLGGGGTAYYVYGLGGQRMRKVIERGGNLDLEWIFLGALVIFRRRRRDTKELRFERWTVHISDDTGRIAQVDIKSLDLDNSDPANPLNAALTRYQYSNHIGSAVLETDEAGNPISYEEYHPYGTTAYRSAKPGYDLSLKRFRFSGKERDDETGLYYIGARYYASWLGRWTSSDPAGFVDTLNLFVYCRNNPIGNKDHTGHNTTSNDDTYIYKVHGTRYGNPHVKDFKARFPGFDSRINKSNATITFQPDLEQIPDSGGWIAKDTGWWVLSAHFPRHKSPAKKGSHRHAVPNPTRVARTIINKLNEPKPGPGHSTEGSMNLWSGKGGEKNAQKAEGYVLRDTEHQGEIENQVKQAEAAKGSPLDWNSEEKSIWSEGSREFAREGALSGRGIRSHGLDTHPNPSKTIQSEVEIPTVRIWGGAMAGLGVVSGGLSIYAASHIQNEAVRDAGYISGGTELGGWATYGAGIALVGRSAASAEIMKLGTRLGKFGGGAGMVIMGSYAAVQDISSGNYGVVLGDTSTVVAGGATLAGAAPVAAIAGAIALTNQLGDLTESVVTPKLGRTAGVVSGTVAGAVSGAALGAAIGVAFFGVGAGVGAIVGGVIGGIAGFIGAYW